MLRSACKGTSRSVGSVRTGLDPPSTVIPTPDKLTPIWLIIALAWSSEPSIDRPAGVLDHGARKPAADCVDCGKRDAEIRCQAAQVHPLEAALLEIALQAGLGFWSFSKNAE